MTESTADPQWPESILGPWPRRDRCPPLAPGALHLWRLELPAVPPDGADLALLSAPERQRIQGPAALRHRFVHTRAALRRILAGYLDAAPRQLVLEYGDLGKPALAAPHAGLHFNLTHSGPLTLLAVTWDGPLGLDAEALRPRPGLPAIARRMLGEDLAQRLARLPPEQQPPLFMLHWTRLEAGVKALGSGLFAGQREPSRKLNYQPFRPAPGYLGCLAAVHALPPPECWQWYCWCRSGCPPLVGNLTLDT
jgi:phosphopantetheinyl transferase